MQQSLSTDVNNQDFYINHAVQYTIQDMTDSTTSTSFWIDFLALSMSRIEATRYALIALAAAHIHFLTGRTDNCSTSEATEHERFVTLHYNLAIRHLQPLLSDPTPENAEAALACCLLFICLENVRGRYAEALKHLQSGVDLLASLLVPHSAHHHLGRTRKGRLPVTLHQAISSIGQRKRSIDHIAVLFSRLSLETHILTDNDVISLTTIARASADLDHTALQSPAPILSFDAARDELHLFEIAHDIFYQQAYGQIESRPDHADLQPGQLLPKCDSPVFSDSDKATYRRIYRQFWQWSARFDQYMAEHASNPMRSSEDSSNACKVRLLQKTWIAIIAEQPWAFSGTCTTALGVLDEFLPEVESIIKLRGSSSRRLFTLGANVVPYITLAGCLTGDLGLLRRIASALRQLDRREGLWDSKDIAEIFEASIIAREELGLQVGCSRRGILHMAKSLSAMNTAYISPNNSIARLARNMET